MVIQFCFSIFLSCIFLNNYVKFLLSNILKIPYVSCKPRGCNQEHLGGAGSDCRD